MFQLVQLKIESFPSLFFVLLLKFEVNINNWRMSESLFSFSNLEIHQKTARLHFELRSKYIQSYKSQIRKQNECQQSLQMLLQSLPSELQDVLLWCKQVVLQFSKSREYRVPDYKIIQLFKLIEKFPCLETITLLYLVAHRISMAAVHQLFQYDIVGLLHKMIINPEKILPRRLIANMSNFEIENMLIQIAKKSMLVLASLAEESEKARNFIVMSHKSYLCLNKALKKYGTQTVGKEFSLCLYAFTFHPMSYDEQFVRIVKNLCEAFCRSLDSQYSQQAVLTIKSLTSAVKCKQKWVMDLIEENCQYDLLDCVLRALKKCTEASEQELAKSTELDYRKNKELLKQLGEVVHLLNIFLINYIEVTINQYFDWEGFFSQWFAVLAINDSHFQVARRDIYFVFNNIICQSDEPQTGYHLLRNLVFQHNCIHVFARQLELETNEEVLQQLSFCVHSLLSLKKIHTLANDIISSNLLVNSLEAVTRNFNSGNCDTKQALISGILRLLENTPAGEVLDKYCCDLKCYKNKLEQVCLIYGKQNALLGEVLDKIMDELKNNR